MSLPDVRSRAEWLAARKQLLAREKELTRLHDALNSDRRRLPMVLIEKPYVFDGPGGKATLLDLFEGRRQLMLQHFMFDPSWEDGCPSCSADADERSDGLVAHLDARTTTFAAVSRAPLAKLEAYKARKGWTFPWYSSYGSDFNYDFHATIDESVAPLEVNYRTRAELEHGLARALGAHGRAADRDAGHQLLPARGRRRLPHQLGVRSWHRGDRRRLRVPRPDGARPPGGLGGAQGARRRSVRRDARLRRVSTFEPVSDARPDDRPWPPLAWPLEPGVRLGGRVVELTLFDRERDAEPLFATLDANSAWAHVAGRPPDAATYGETLAAAPGTGPVPVGRAARRAAGRPGARHRRRYVVLSRGVGSGRTPRDRFHGLRRARLGHAPSTPRRSCCCSATRSTSSGPAASS